MTDTKPDLKPNERKVLDSLLALGEATAAKAGEHAGLAYSTTTPLLRKLEAAGLAERFRNEASQTLWRATPAAGGNDDKAAQAASPAADEPGHAGNSDTTAADDAAAHDSAAPETPEAAPQTPATPAAALGADRPAEPDVAEVDEAEPQEAQPEQAEPVEPGGDSPDSTTSTAAEPAATGDGAAVPADPSTPKAKRKRPAGALEASVLAILQGDPTGQYKINELRKRVDKADEATGYPAASAGAIANALDKLTGKALVVAIPAKHATFQAAPTTG